MNLTELLSLGASLFGSSQGAGAGGAQSGFLSSLLSGGPSTTTSPTASTDWGSILSAIGQTAGQIKATPRAGASRKDIEKANRINLLTGLLGGGAQIAGGLMSQQRKGEAYSALGDILSGRGTTTGQAVIPSEGAIGGTTPTVTTGTTQSPFTRTMALAEQYPELADKFLDVGIKQQQAAQNAQLKLADMYRKAQPTIQDELAVSNILKNQGILPEDIPGETQRRLQEIQKTRLGALGTLPDTSSALRGLGGPESMATQPTATVTTQPPAPTQRETPIQAKSGISVDEVIARAQRGETVDETFAPGAESQIMDRLRQQGFMEQPSVGQQLLSPGMVSETPSMPKTPETAQERAAQKRAQEEQLKQRKEQLGIEAATVKIERTKAEMESLKKKDIRQEKAATTTKEASDRDFAFKVGQSIELESRSIQLDQALKNLDIANRLLYTDNPTYENHQKLLAALQKTIDTSQFTLGELDVVDQALRSKQEKWKNQLNSILGKTIPPYDSEQLASLKRDAFEIGNALLTNAKQLNDEYDIKVGNKFPEFRPKPEKILKGYENLFAKINEDISGRPQQTGIVGVTPTPTPRSTMSPLAGLTATPTSSPYQGLSASRAEQIRRLEEMTGGKLIGIK